MLPLQKTENSVKDNPIRIVYKQEEQNTQWYVFLLISNITVSSPDDSKPGLETKAAKLLADYFQQGLEPPQSSKHVSILLLVLKRELEWISCLISVSRAYFSNEMFSFHYALSAKISGKYSCMVFTQEVRSTPAWVHLQEWKSPFSL